MGEPADEGDKPKQDKDLDSESIDNRYGLFIEENNDSETYSSVIYGDAIVGASKTDGMLISYIYHMLFPI